MCVFFFTAVQRIARDIRVRVLAAGIMLMAALTALIAVILINVIIEVNRVI